MRRLESSWFLAFSGCSGTRCGVAETADLVKEISALVKAVTELVHDKSEKEKPSTRSGPLQVAGRLYVSLAALLALFATGSGYLDGGAISCTTTILRFGVLIAVAFGIFGVCGLVWYLSRKSPSWLSNPAEFSAAAQLGMLQMSDTVEGPPIGSISETRDQLS